MVNTSCARREALACAASLGSMGALPGFIDRGHAAQPTEHVETQISLIGLPYLFGRRQPTKNYAMATGPVALLDPANVPAAMRLRFRDVEVRMVDDVDDPDARHLINGKPMLIEGNEMTRILAQAMTMSQTVQDARQRGRLPIACIGTCSGAIGIVGGIGDASGPIGMIFFDTHSDAATPDTSRSGFVEGMAATLIAGKAFPRYTQNIPGFRPIDEARIISVGLGTHPYPDNGPNRALGIAIHTSEIDRIGVKAALGPALDQLRSKCSQLYVHIDTDCMSTSVMMAIRNYTAQSGLTDVQVRDALDLIAERFEILAIAFSSFDPTADNRNMGVVVPLIVRAADAAARSRRTA